MPYYHSRTITISDLARAFFHFFGRTASSSPTAYYNAQRQIAHYPSEYSVLQAHLGPINQIIADRGGLDLRQFLENAFPELERYSDY